MATQQIRFRITAALHGSLLGLPLRMRFPEPLQIPCRLLPHAATDLAILNDRDTGLKSAGEKETRGTTEQAQMGERLTCGGMPVRMQEYPAAI
jgi:hypothetical protein